MILKRLRLFMNESNSRYRLLPRAIFVTTACMRHDDACRPIPEAMGRTAYGDQRYSNDMFR